MFWISSRPYKSDSECDPDDDVIPFLKSGLPTECYFSTRIRFQITLECHACHTNKSEVTLLVDFNHILIIIMMSQINNGIDQLQPLSRLVHTSNRVNTGLHGFTGLYFKGFYAK